MFLKLKHHTGPLAINTLHVIAMSPNTEEGGGTDIVLVDGKNITVENDFDAIWERMKGVNGTNQVSYGRGANCGRSFQGQEASGEADPGTHTGSI
jgi:hypothetical protein